MRDENIHIRPSIAITKAVRISRAQNPQRGRQEQYEDKSGKSWLSELVLLLYIPSERGDTNPEIITQHMRLPELEQSVREGRIVPDEKICLNGFGELAVTKFAVEPVWYLPGVAERFGIGEHKSSAKSVSYHETKQHQTKGLCGDLYSRTQEDLFQNSLPAEISSFFFLVRIFDFTPPFRGCCQRNMLLDCLLRRYISRPGNSRPSTPREARLTSIL